MNSNNLSSSSLCVEDKSPVLVGQLAQHRHEVLIVHLIANLDDLPAGFFSKLLHLDLSRIYKGGLLLGPQGAEGYGLSIAELRLEPLVPLVRQFLLEFRVRFRDVLTHALVGAKEG